ncbi:MAG: hypothetical protein ACKO6B_03785 [Planctomycetia bacterium]
MTNPTMVPVMLLAAVLALGGLPERGALADEKADKKDKAEGKEQKEDPQEAQLRQQIKQQATHWEEQFTKLLYGDLELLRSICGDLPRESRRAIAKAGEQAVKDAALRMAELQMGGRGARVRQGQLVIQGGGIAIEGGKVIINGVAKVLDQVVAPGKRAAAAGEPENPLGMLAEALTKSVARHVGEEQATAFANQLAGRKARRREAMIREIVAALDGELVLTDEQRRAIEESLRAKWSESMAMMLQGMHMQNGIRVFPGLPDDCVRPHLGEAQRQRFVAQPRANNGGQVPWQQQEWMQTVNLLGNVQTAGRDPWWFE